MHIQTCEGLGLRKERRVGVRLQELDRFRNVRNLEIKEISKINLNEYIFSPGVSQVSLLYFCPLARYLTVLESSVHHQNINLRDPFYSLSGKTVDVSCWSTFSKYPVPK